MSDSLRPHGLWSTRLLCPWDFPGQSTRMAYHFLFQGIFPTQGSNQGLPHCGQMLYLWATREANLDSILKSKDITLPTKIHIAMVHQSYGFSSSYVWMWELDHKEGWVPKNRCLQTVVLEKTPESPLGSKEIQPVHPKGNWLWIFIGKTDAEAEAPILWPPDAKSQFIGKDPDAGKDWGQ